MLHTVNTTKIVTDFPLLLPRSTLVVNPFQHVFLSCGYSSRSIISSISRSLLKATVYYLCLNGLMPLFVKVERVLIQYDGEQFGHDCWLSCFALIPYKVTVNDTVIINLLP